MKSNYNNKYLFYWLFLLLFVSLNNDLCGQLKLDKEIDLPILDIYNEPEYEVINKNNDGILVIEKYEREANSFKPFWRIFNFNNNFEKNWETEIKIDLAVDEGQYCITESAYYQIFTYKNKATAQLLIIQIETGHYDWIALDLKTMDQINDLKVIGASIFLSGMYLNRPIITQYSTLDNTIKILPGYFEKNFNLVNLDTLNNQLQVFQKSNYKLNCAMDLAVFDVFGELYEKIEIENEEKNSPVFLNILQNNKINKAVGFYGNNCDEKLKGICTVKPNGSTKYLGFEQLEHFFDHLSTKKRSKIQKNIKKNSKKIQQYHLINNTLTHNPLPTNGGFNLQVDFFYPIPSQRYKGKPYFEAFTHSVVLEYDSLGNLKNHIALPLKNVEAELHKKVITHLDLIDSTLFCYIDNEKIVGKVISKNSVSLQKYEYDFGYDLEQYNNESLLYLDRLNNKNIMIWGIGKKINSTSKSQKTFFIQKLLLENKKQL